MQMKHGASLLVFNSQIIKNLTSSIYLCIDSIAFISETVLGYHTLEQYSKLLRANVRYREVVALAGALKPTARLKHIYPSFYYIYYTMWAPYEIGIYRYSQISYVLYSLQRLVSNFRNARVSPAYL